MPAPFKKNSTIVSVEEAKQIGERLGITFKIFTPEQFTRGINHENQEHGDITMDNPFLAAQIARPHLEEDPEYYEKLEKAVENTKQKKNVKQLPKRYYARAMEAGVCQYSNEMILVTNEALKNMAPTAEGVPLYVQHVEDVDLANLENEAEGYVVKCFYNEKDGHWWMEFMAVSDDAHAKIRNGWKVSTAYMPAASQKGGTYHNVKYDREILSGEYTHLAIVNNPRYENAIIMSPEEFSEYNNKKEREIQELKNSKGRKIRMKFWEKKEVTNAVDIKDAVVELDNGKQISLSEMINAVEKADANKQEIVNGDSEVVVNGKKMKISELVAKYNESEKAEEEKEKQQQETEEEKKKREEEEKAKEAAKKKNEEEEEKKKEEEKQAKKNALEQAEKAAKEARENFEKLNNAAGDPADKGQIIHTPADRVKRGQEMFGSPQS